MDPFDEHIVGLIKKKHKGVKTKTILNWSESNSYWASQNYKTSAYWVERTIELLNMEKNKVDVEKFYINVAGLVIDLPDLVAAKSRVLDTFAKQVNLETWISSIQDPIMRTHLEHVVELREVYKDVQKGFSKNDIFAISFFRHGYCHPFLSAYKVKMASKRGGVLEFKAENYKKFSKLGKFAHIDLFEKIYKKLKKKEKILVRLQALLWSLKS